MKKDQKHIVVVGGGAGGLELVTLLGSTLGKNNLAKISLVDINLTHIWKPLWHEMAAGTLDSNEDELNYIVHAYHHYFDFQLGQLIGLDRHAKTINLAPLIDQEKIVLPERKLSYDILVIAIGSLSNDFNIPGVKQHCYFLDSHEDCHRLHRSFLNHLLRVQASLQAETRISIIGGGATGVELAAELQFAATEALNYKTKNQQKSNKLEITLIESSDRLLSSLKKEISQTVHDELKKLGINVLTSTKVTRVDADCVQTDKGTIPAELKLWAAGIMAPPVLKMLGLQTNQLGQLRVKPSLQTLDDDNIFAFGDCASCPQPASNHSVPPRAQAAHQQAKHLAKSLGLHLKGHNLPAFIYRDHGSLISLSQSNALGQLMGQPIGPITLRGKLALFTYRFLYRQHQAILHGWLRTAILCTAHYLTRTVRPRLKLH